jgi:hypothetical protein
MVALTVLMGGTVFAATTYLIDRATDLNAETRNAAGTAINDSAVGSLDSKAVHGLVAPVTTAQPAASPAVTEQDLAAFADSIRKQLTAEFQRDTAALSDSIRASIERDVIARIRAATSRGGDARQFAGSRGGNTPRSPEELRRLPFPGEKRVLVTDFNVRIGRPDSGLGARLGTELRAALRRTGEGYVAINGRDARQAAGSDDARVMIDYVHAGALLTGYVFPRGSDSVVVRMVMIEPARGTSPRPLGSYVVPIANADTAIVSFMPSAVEVLRRVTWPAGREGGRGRRGGAAAPGSRNAPPSSQATGPAGTPGTAPPTVPPPRDSGGPNHRME